MMIHGSYEKQNNRGKNCAFAPMSNHNVENGSRARLNMVEYGGLDYGNQEWAAPPEARDEEPWDRSGSYPCGQ